MLTMLTSFLDPLLQLKTAEPERKESALQDTPRWNQEYLKLRPLAFKEIHRLCVLGAYHRDVLYTAWSYLDRYWNLNANQYTSWSDPNTKVHSYACLSLSIKMCHHYEKATPHLFNIRFKEREFNTRSKVPCKLEEIVQAELHVLFQLQWNLVSPSECSPLVWFTTWSSDNGKTKLYSDQAFLQYVCKVDRLIIECAESPENRSLKEICFDCFNEISCTGTAIIDQQTARTDSYDDSYVLEVMKVASL